MLLHFEGRNPRYSELLKSRVAAYHSAGLYSSHLVEHGEPEGVAIPQTSVLKVRAFGL